MKKIMRWLGLIVLISSLLACRTTFNDGQSTQAPPAPFSFPTPILPLSSPAVITNSPSPQASEDVLVALYERVSPGVVSLLVTSDLGYAQGSGFVIDTEGHVVTNYHVVEGATKVEVDFPSGFKAYGNVVGTDLDSDLAVVKVDAAADHFTPIPLGDSDQLKVGQTVVAIGNPFGLSGTMTVGIISARGRTLSSMRQTPEGAYYTAGDLLQTDAAINPGNSGGPLINLNGEVVGVNRAIQTSSSTLGGTPVNSGVGFAVSVNIVRRVVPLLIQQGKVDYPYLGITSLPDISLTEQEALGLTQTNGGYITSVVTGGPADAAGLRGGTRPTSIEGLQAGGDLIIGVDNQQVVVFGDLLRYLMLNKSPGDTIKLIILRDNQQKEVTLTLGKRP
jgi:S1-C subfamily serine protease